MCIKISEATRRGFFFNYRTRPRKKEDDEFRFKFLLNRQTREIPRPGSFYSEKSELIFNSQKTYCISHTLHPIFYRFTFQKGSKKIKCKKWDKNEVFEK